MRAVVQRVITPLFQLVLLGTISKGIVVFLGITATDGIKDQIILSINSFHEDF